MDYIDSIQDNLKLEFVIFCVENIAKHLGKDGSKVYTAFAEKSTILKDYIIPEYEMLHTQSKEYIIHDILEVMKEMEVEI
ncbi:MAG: DUF3791 domain-containing protein [Clostridium sp.]|nr:DUF3791 domain-containing protein [Clostridium sp.]MCM1209660.1 DUF3791 domain-containing protein [Ruminococcus sp.]